ncbi:hypothetical protein ACLOJK_032142 [Asimina triloba]
MELKHGADNIVVKVLMANHLPVPITPLSSLILNSPSQPNALSAKVTSLILNSLSQPNTLLQTLPQSINKNNDSLTHFQQPSYVNGLPLTLANPPSVALCSQSSADYNVRSSRFHQPITTYDPPAFISRLP